MDKRVIGQLREYFSGQPIVKAYIFGSFSRGEEDEDSDVDLLVEFDKAAKVSLIGYARMKRQLESLLGREVDLVEEGSLLPFARKSAERDKKLIYERTS